MSDQGIVISWMAWGMWFGFLSALSVGLGLIPPVVAGILAGAPGGILVSETQDWWKSQ